MTQKRWKNNAETILRGKYLLSSEQTRNALDFLTELEKLMHGREIHSLAASLTITLTSLYMSEGLMEKEEIREFNESLNVRYLEVFTRRLKKQMKKRGELQ